MKTQSKLNVNYSQVRLPEIIVWILGVLTFIGLFFGFNLNAQTTDNYKQDTIWLKNGEIIACKISDQVTSENYLSFSHKSTDGNLVFDQVSKKEIQYYKRDISDKDKFLVMCKLELKDGAILSGNIISETETNINFYTTDIGMINIYKDRIKRIHPINAPKEVKKAYWFKNPHATRLLFAPYSYSA